MNGFRSSPINPSANSAGRRLLAHGKASITHVTIRGMDEPLAYRHKAATPLRRGRGPRFILGFTRKWNAQDCTSKMPPGKRTVELVPSSTTWRILLAVQHPCQEDRGKGALRHGVVRCQLPPTTSCWCWWSTVSICLTSRSLLPRFARHPELTSIFSNVQPKKHQRNLGAESRALGLNVYERQALDCTFEIGQLVSTRQSSSRAEVLYQLAIDGALC